MSPVIENLKECELLYNQNITDLKIAISKKYPSYSSKQTSVLLAKAIHQIIDTHLSCFSKTTQIAIKKALFEKATQKEHFSINAFDVFNTCTNLELTDETFLLHLKDWVNTYQDTPVSAHEISCLISEIRQISNPLASPLNTYSEEQVSLYRTFIDFLKGISFKWSTLVPLSLLLFAMIALPVFKNRNAITPLVHEVPVIAASEETIKVIPENTIHEEENVLPAKIKYKEIDENLLSDWLREKNSLLAEEPYFSSILTAAAKYQVNPLFLFAITGQEQSFVPKSNEYAYSIANNPFNVYGSWKHFNTTISESSSIAARTVINLSKDCPKEEDPIKWINKQYAEDMNWHLGVSKIFKELEEVAGK